MLNGLGDVTRRAREINALLGGSAYFDAINAAAARSAQQVQAAIEALHLDEASQAAQQLLSTQAESWATQQAKAMEDAIESARRMIDGTRIDQLSREMAQVESMRAALASEVRHAAEVARRFAEQLVGPLDQHLQIREALLPQVSISALNAAIGAFPADGYLGDLLGQGPMAAAINSLRSAIEAPSVERIAQALDLMDVGVEGAIEAEPADLQLRLFLLGVAFTILLAVLTTLHAQWLADLSSEQVADLDAKMTEQFRLLRERLDAFRDVEDNHREFDFYRVERRAPLVQMPRAKGKVLAWIEPGALLSVLEDRDTWVHVDFPEASPGMPREGWIRRKYLAR